MSVDLSPFRSNRYELEEDRRHVYFLLPDDLEKLEELKSSYIVGTRGTGKTTLLKSLSWKERLESRSLRQALDGDLRFDRYLGVYMKLPEYQLRGLGRWLSSAEPEQRDALTSLYLDLIWLEALLVGVEEMRARGEFDYGLEAETDFVKWFCNWWSLRGGTLIELSSPSLPALEEVLVRVRSDIERASRSKLDPDQVLDRLPVDQIGALGRESAERLRGLCEPEEDEGQQWHIRICLDEAEALSEEQQRVFNTMVRLSRFPLFFTAAFAAMPRDPSTTLIENQTLSEADRHLDIRDDMDDLKFKQLTVGVSESRVRARLADEDASFDLDAILGPLELDRWSEEILRRSESDEVKVLLDRARRLADARGESENAPAPILETYLAEFEQREPPVSPSRQERSRGSRKKEPAVYIALLHKLGFKPRYASAQMVLQLSDGCIRDFLSQMDELYSLRGQGLREFISSAQVPSEEQDKALRAASKVKRQNLVRRVETNPPEEVERIVDGLARVTAELQKNLEVAEPGRFLLRGDLEAKDLKSEVNVLREANQTGYLRILKEEGSRMVFRVHTSLAPQYGFSYRGSYYEVALTASDLTKLRTARDHSVATKVVASIVQRFSPPASSRLFEPTGSDD